MKTPATAKKRTQVLTQQYEFHHGGKTPRGYGEWAFGLKMKTSRDQCAFILGNFAEAKRQAREIFKDHCKVWVQA